MKGRFFDVVAYIAERYGAQAAVLHDPLQLRDELLDAGYQEDEVERAIAWLSRLAVDGLTPRDRVEDATTAHRVPCPEEEAKLTPEAWGFLLRLEHAGILSPAMRELVYERALSVDVPQLSVEELRVLVALLFKAAPSVDDRVATYVLTDELELVYH